MLQVNTVLNSVLLFDPRMNTHVMSVLYNGDCYIIRTKIPGSEQSDLANISLCHLQHQVRSFTEFCISIVPAVPVRTGILTMGAMGLSLFKTVLHHCLLHICAWWNILEKARRTFFRVNNLILKHEIQMPRGKKLGC